MSLIDQLFGLIGGGSNTSSHVESASSEVKDVSSTREIPVDKRNKDSSLGAIPKQFPRSNQHGRDEFRGNRRADSEIGSRTFERNWRDDENRIGSRRGSESSETSQSSHRGHENEVRYNRSEHRGRGNGERGRGNGERGCGNGERGRGNGERGRGNGERGRGNSERGRGSGERGRGNSERGRGNGERGRGNDQRGRGKEQRDFGIDPKSTENVPRGRGNGRDNNPRRGSTGRGSVPRGRGGYGRYVGNDVPNQNPFEPQELISVDEEVVEKLALKKDIKSQPESGDVKGFRYTNIQGLLKKDPDDLLLHLNVNKQDFCHLLKQQLRPDMIMLVAAMFARVSASTMRENLAALLAHSVQPRILEQFSAHSFDIVAKMNYSSNEVMKYFENLYTLYQDVVDIMPSKASEILSDHSTKAVMALQSLSLLRKVSIPRKLDEDYKVLMASVESLKEERASTQKNVRKFKDKSKREWQPGIDFRQLSVYPLPEDLICQVEVNLCPVVIDGPYKSVEHYLDVQFNLMREDFLIPLRDGIASFVEQQASKERKHKRIENVRFYRGVRFINQFVDGDSLVTEVQFMSRKNPKKTNWKRSKRFMYGGLLCFTSDTFKSIILGIVYERRVELLEKGILRCELLGEVRDDDLFKKEFIMAENEVYFEAYVHVLKVLQSFNETNFPLQDYLINVTKELHLPNYLADDPYLMYEIDDYEFPVLDEHFWPPFNHLKVNESQWRALHSALTKKCAVIQGPPGTGKTYLGLIIARILLKNAEHWRRGRKGPMLVVCFTNHALDQFLEGMLSFTDNIVRVGGQSKNEKLNDYNMRVVRRKKGIRGMALHGIEADLENSSREMNYNNEVLKECLKGVGIFSLKILWHWMAQHQISWFSVNGELKDSLLIEWLLFGAFYHEITDVNVSTEDLDPVAHGMEGFYAITLENIKTYIEQLNIDVLAADVYEQDTINNIMMMYVGRFHYLRAKLEEPFENNEKLIAELSALKNVSELHPDRRWILYRHWLSQAVDHYQGKLMVARKMYQGLHNQKSEILEAMYLETILDCDVVGMTTTGAARHQSMLQKLGAKIVIVEEAAEAMESHIIACLSSKCEHLILIGDHKQLRPSPAVYRLAKDYHLEISLFERLLMNGIRFDTLEIQHRMRPDIADLVFPAVYPVLENHPSVLAYDNIVGLKKNLFFINHSHPEESAMDDLSKRNTHEAQFLIALCRHLILQGYEPSQITILATYLGQMFLLSEERENHPITKDVRIAVVDNFQGEENDIILLSLVRNNPEEKIGFLASENRVCVSLSRAKKGLYIMGNMNMLAKHSKLWSKVRDVLLEKDALGSHLTLQCLKHPDQLTKVSKAEDFTSITEGGCTLMCGEKLNCGHICKKMCHVQGHLNQKCHEVCEKVMCERNHRCKKFCWQDCGDCMVPVKRTLPCGHRASFPCHVDAEEYVCKAEVSVKLPDCMHTNKKLCFEDVAKVMCLFPCDSRLPCGHVCTKLCHVKVDPDHLEYKCLRPCDRKNLECKEEHQCQRKCFEECGLCTVKLKRKLPNCDHVFEMQCATDPLTVACHKPCRKKLACGHVCPLKCLQPCGGCKVIVEKIIPDCGHSVKMMCSQAPERRFCKEKCTRTRSCGHKCADKCGNPCNEKKCQSLSCETSRAACGHEIRLFCHEITDVPTAAVLMKRCKEPCGKILMCSHRCRGTCGQCMQGRIHLPCQEKCGRNLICGHECRVSCSQSCPPCKEKCFVLCEHSKCKNQCGRPCVPCQERCGWQCEHFRCNKKCSEMCDRPPCNEPCKEKLKCGHDCIGFCGERCPDLCRECNKEEVEEIMIFLATEDEENARFVVLPDCGHVFEVTGLDRWISMNDSTVKMLECPMCKTPIQQAYRYANSAKMRFNHVLQVKRKVFGNVSKVKETVINAAKKLRSLTNYDDFKKSQSCLDELQHLIGRSKKAQYGAAVLNSLEARTEFVLTIVEHFNEHKSKLNPLKDLGECASTANKLVRTMLGRMEILSEQEHSDFEGECMRFHLLMNLRALENTPQFKSSTKSGWWYIEYLNCIAIIEDAKAFRKDRYGEVLEKLGKVNATLASGVALSKSEMRQVVNAIGLHQGHWYRCPNGHVFSIGECGQAMQLGRCADCGAEIGGGSHQLLSTNTRVAGLPEGL
ncbi:NFX1-type zinc finger-containing protein 1-like isoform X2 [Ischnura elegans]|uniref:NFX1-type zinc finger-containing protein 1-like isoform X2 n=1 Tax=Ischnura elegans TaxID=197161 RepID=UPI001ED897E1|nr:NFX1-type zinc finger-containing protein 1-like isoform X2 [Ischnura elegans]